MKLTKARRTVTSVAPERVVIGKVEGWERAGEK